MSTVPKWLLIIGGAILIISAVVHLIASFFTKDIPNVLKGKQSCLDSLIYMIGGLIAVAALVCYAVCKLFGI